MRKQYLVILLAVVVMVGLSASAFAQSGVPKNSNPDWKFSRAEAKGCYQVVFGANPKVQGTPIQSKWNAEKGFAEVVVTNPKGDFSTRLAEAEARALVLCDNPPAACGAKFCGVIEH
jgi:hypothetical protein